MLNIDNGYVMTVFLYGGPQNLLTSTNILFPISIGFIVSLRRSYGGHSVYLGISVSPYQSMVTI